MPQQKQRLFSQEVELMSSAVLNAAETPIKVKKKAFLSNICSSEQEWPLYIVPRFYPSPGQSHEAIEAEQEGRVGLCLQVPGSFFLTLGNTHPTLSNLFPICRHLANRKSQQKVIIWWELGYGSRSPTSVAVSKAGSVQLLGKTV